MGGMEAGWGRKYRNGITDGDFAENVIGALNRGAQSAAWAAGMLAFWSSDAPNKDARKKMLVGVVERYTWPEKKGPLLSALVKKGLL